MVNIHFQIKYPLQLCHCFILVTVYILSSFITLYRHFMQHCCHFSDSNQRSAQQCSKLQLILIHKAESGTPFWDGLVHRYEPAKFKTTNKCTVVTPELGGFHKGRRAQHSCKPGTAVCEPFLRGAACLTSLKRLAKQECLVVRGLVGLLSEIIPSTNSCLTFHLLHCFKWLLSVQS